MKTSCTLTCILLSVLITSCNQLTPPNKLPPITTEGKGTFGYKVDGEVLGQCYDGLFSGLAEAQLSGDTTFQVNESCGSHTFSLIIFKGEYRDNSKYDLTSTDAYIKYSPPNSSSFYSYTDDNSLATLEIIKFNTQKKIVAGTFSGILHNEDGESVEITDGRFDLVYSEF